MGVAQLKPVSKKLRSMICKNEMDAIAANSNTTILSSRISMRRTIGLQVCVLLILNVAVEGWACRRQ